MMNRRTISIGGAVLLILVALVFALNSRRSDQQPASASLAQTLQQPSPEPSPASVDEPVDKAVEAAASPESGPQPVRKEQTPEFSRYR